MLKITRKACLLAAGVGMGWSWAPLTAAEISLARRADVVFADEASDVSLTLVDDQRKMCRQQEREWKAQQRDAARAMKQQEKCQAKSSRRDGADCPEEGGRFAGGLCSMGSCFSEPLGDPWTLNSVLWDDCADPCYTIGGWTQFGYTNKSDGVFNTRPDKLNLQQAWIYVEKIADGSNGIGFGGRIDALYGLDADNTQSYGNRPGKYDFSDNFDHGQFGYAIPQAYGQVAYDDLSVKVGHFYTLQGYEVVAATGNFFYSHGLSHNFMEPFTHTGAVATYKVDDSMELYGGYVLGWDSGFDQFRGGSAWHGGFKVSPMDNMAFVYTSTAGNLGWIGDGYSQSIVVTTNVTDELTSVIGGDLVHTNRQVLFGPAIAPVTGNTFNGVSAYNYLLYKLSDRTGVGMRNEWAKFDGVSYHTFTAGLNFKPQANVTIRPEYRYQYSPAGDNNRNNPLGIPVNEGILGVDAVVTF